MKSTSTERTKFTQLGKEIGEKLSSYLAEGKDVRGEVVTLQAELVKARSDLKVKAQPLQDKMAPYVKAGARAIRFSGASRWPRGSPLCR